MQIKHVGYRVPGLRKIASYAFKMEAIMATSAERKYDALIFWDNHGLPATQDAFGVSRSTLYAWRKRHREGGLSGLHDVSKAPKNRRVRRWPVAVVKEIRRLRERHPNVGKEKVHVLLVPWCARRGVRCPGERTIGRLIADAPDKMRKVAVRLDSRGRRKEFKRRPRPRLGKDFHAGHAGHCVAVDTIVRFVNNSRRHIFTATDHSSRFGLALASRRASSRDAACFMRLVCEVFPGRIEKVLTDNGSEYQGEFDEYLKRAGIEHCYTYPRCPKMNALCERFNRTVQEEFVDYREDRLFDDLYAFNDALFTYLERYNGERPHRSLGNITPCQAIQKQLPHLSRMWWPHTTC